MKFDFVEYEGKHKDDEDELSIYSEIATASESQPDSSLVITYSKLQQEKRIVVPRASEDPMERRRRFDFAGCMLKGNPDIESASNIHGRIVLA